MIDNDHGFRKACPSGNHMLENNILLDYKKYDCNEFCDECGKPLNNDNTAICRECEEDQWRIK